MLPNLVESQFATLEDPRDVINVDDELDPEILVSLIQKTLRAKS
jgi:gluconate kinase